MRSTEVSAGAAQAEARPRKRRLLNGILATLYNHAVTMVLQVALVPIFIHAWGVQTYGVWLMLTTVPAYLALGDLGVASAAGTQMTMLNAAGDRKGATLVFESAWTTIVLCCLVIMAVTLAVLFSVPDGSLAAIPATSVAEVRLIVVFLVLYGLFCLLCTVFSAALRADHKFASTMNLFASTYLAEGAVTAIALVGGAKLLGVAAGLLLVRSAGLACFAFQTRRQVTWLRPDFMTPKFRGLSNLVRASLGALALPAALAIILQGSSLAVGAALGPSQVAVFNTVRTITRLGLQLQTMVCWPLRPELSAAYGRNDAEQARKIASLLVYGSTAVLIVVSVFTLAFGIEIVRLWTGSHIVPTPAFFLAMLAGMVIQGLWVPRYSVVAAMNEHFNLSSAYLLLCLVSIPLVYVMSEQLGVLGGALGVLLPDTLMLVFCAVATRGLGLSPGVLTSRVMKHVSRTA